MAVPAAVSHIPHLGRGPSSLLRFRSLIPGGYAEGQLAGRLPQRQTTNSPRAQDEGVVVFPTVSVILLMITIGQSSPLYFKKVI